MAEISEPAAVSPLFPSNSRTDEQKREKKKRGHPQEPATHEDHDIVDVTQIMDIPVEEVTPRVQKTLTAMMREFEKLRTELERARSHIQYLEELAEMHSFLPVINRRGLYRELSRVLGLSGRAELVNSFVCFHVRNMEDIRRRYGHEAVEAGLIWVAGILKDNIRDADTVGSLGGHDFGVILTLADDEKAAEKVAGLAGILEKEMFLWGHKMLKLQVAYGLHTFVANDSVSSVLEKADAALVKKEQLLDSGDNVG